MRRLDEIDLFAGQEVVLLELAARGELNQTELAAALDVEPPSVTSIVGKLEAGGLVARVPRGREKRITLTDAGHRAAEQAREVYAAIERDLSEGLTPAQVSSMVAALETVSEQARKAMPKSNPLEALSDGVVGVANPPASPALSAQRAQPIAIRE